MKSPVFLTLTELLEPAKQAHARLQNIKLAHVKADEFGNAEEDSNFIAITNQGMFLLAVSSLEVMMQEVLRIILKSFPEKMSRTQVPMNQVIQATHTSEVFDLKAEEVVRDQMYKDTTQVLKYFAETVGVSSDDFRADQIDYLVEIRQTRNLLLHNDLMVNDFYVSRSGKCCRANIGDRLSLDSVYLGDTLVTVKYFIIEIEAMLTNKFGKYTRCAALRRLWDFMVHNPTITPFEEFWEVDETNDVIRMKDNEEYEKRMGSAERVFLQMWRNLFVGHGAPPYPDNFTLTCLDRWSRQKVALLLTVSQKFGVLANR